MERVREEEKTREDFHTHEYLIYFIETGQTHWWDRVFRTPEGFKHCFATQWCEWSKRWIMVDWRQSRTDFIVFFDFEIESLLRGVASMKGTVVKFRAVSREGNEGYLITYCSNILSRYLGLGNSLILTPHGLYRRLLKSGGEVIFSWRDVPDEHG